MTNKDFNTLMIAAKKEEDKDRFVETWGASPLSPCNDNDLLCLVWDAAHMTVQQIRAAATLTQAKLAELFHIPLRTVQCWEQRGSCPIYVRLMMMNILRVSPLSHRISDGLSGEIHPLT